MKYRQLNQTYRDDTLADALYAREVEFFHYDFDRANFTEMLRHIPKGEYRKLIEKRLADTEGQMQQVELIYAALTAQITDPAAHAAALARVSKKRNID